MITAASNHQALKTICHIILLLLIAGLSVAQQRPVSFAQIDERVKTIASTNPANLAFSLTKDYTTDREKLRSIFSWIAEHISYRVKKNNLAIKNNYAIRVAVTDTGQWKSANEMVAETVLQNRSAMCDGYARLFKTLCDYAGLRSAIITGFAKGDLSRQLKFRCNHTWNAVYIDSAWQLLDVTWASGYTSYSGDEFFKRFDEAYFLSSPDVFIRDHFPDDLRWTLLEKPEAPREFMNGPYRIKSFTKYRISAFSPGNGIIEAAMGDTIQITIQTTDLLADSKMAADTLTLLDSCLQSILPAIAVIEPTGTDKKNQLLHYSFLAGDDKIEWLHINYNHDTVLRYRLKIKKDKPGFASYNPALPLKPFMP